MSIAGISSNFSALNTTDVQAAQQYTEDEQLLSETLQTQNLTNTAASNTATLSSSLQPALNATLTALNPSGSETGTAENLLTTLDENAGAGQNAGGVAAANNPSQTNNSAQTTATQTGALQSLAQSTRARAQQAYTTAQQGYPATNHGGGTGGAIIG